MWPVTSNCSYHARCQSLPRPGREAWGHLMHGSHPASSGAPRDNIAKPKTPRLPPCCVRPALTERARWVARWLPGGSSPRRLLKSGIMTNKTGRGHVFNPPRHLAQQPMMVAFHLWRLGTRAIPFWARYRPDRYISGAGSPEKNDGRPGQRQRSTEHTGRVSKNKLLEALDLDKYSCNQQYL